MLRACTTGTKAAGVTLVSVSTGLDLLLILNRKMAHPVNLPTPAANSIPISGRYQQTDDTFTLHCVFLRQTLISFFTPFLSA